MVSKKIMIQVCEEKKSKSFRGLNWVFYETDELLINSFIQRLGISDIMARILNNRQVKTINDAKAFLSPKLRDSLPDPRQLLDMDKATDRVIRALNDEEKITIFADYDVDGATSASLLHRFFDSLGEKVDVYIPNRFSEGYGPNKDAFDKIKYKGSSLVIIADCGSVAFEPLSYAKKIGLDVIILDHHVTDTKLPEAFALLNPNRYDETFQPKGLAAVAVSFLFLIALRADLRKRDWFKTSPEPDLMEFLDLVALGTVCDLMPLIPLNRAFIKQGLKLIGDGFNSGIAAIMEAAKIRCKPQSHHLGYTVGPRINAGGRLDDSSLGFRLLSAKNFKEAQKVAEELELLNSERKTLEAMTLEDAQASILQPKNQVIISIGRNWHLGVLGIIASRLKEDHHKPSFIMAIDQETRVAKGSVRSIRGVDAALLIQEAKDLNLIIEGGGHAMAGGFSVEEAKLEVFCEFLRKRVKEILDDSPKLLSEAKKIMVDATLSVAGVTPELFKEISKLEPYGLGNPKPYFLIENLLVKNITQNKGITFITVADIFNPSYNIKCLSFNNQINSIFSTNEAKAIKILGTLQANNIYEGQVNFVIEDVELYD
jgi:single-stranded-DNA-specific exonuclease